MMARLLNKKSKLMACLLFCCWFALPASASALVIDFEDTVPGTLPDGYKNLHWSNVSVETSPGLLSGNVAYGTQISISADQGSDFNLLSMEIASETSNTIWIEAYSYSDKLLTQELNLDELDELLLELDLRDVTTLNIWSSDNATFLLDNIEVAWLCCACSEGVSVGTSSGGGSLPGGSLIPLNNNLDDDSLSDDSSDSNNNLIINTSVDPSQSPGDDDSLSDDPFSDSPDDSPAPVPEPSTMALFGIGTAAIAAYRKRFGKA
ncbi:MAG: PEP-CTERM sorting domain-containing protein [Thermodesulfobacteria bacterium]|nr:PEP-CTERM sorting domain-containing protein [Thermodesulfobacteriota bacterium]